MDHDLGERRERRARLVLEVHDRGAADIDDRETKLSTLACVLALGLRDAGRDSFEFDGRELVLGLGVAECLSRSLDHFRIDGAIRVRAGHVRERSASSRHCLTENADARFDFAFAPLHLLESRRGNVGRRNAFLEFHL
jgi:hypothetical protein